MYVGIDDTDSPRGGCTTFALTELARVASEQGLDLLGEPHLVRLNPNVPWKTRGNAALALRVGHGQGPAKTVGERDGDVVRAYGRGTDLAPGEVEGFLDAAWSAVLGVARPEPGTDPALVASDRPLPAEVYWNAVRDRVTVPTTLRALRRAGAQWRVRSGRRGLIGAAAAVAWPGLRSTWELIAYRRPERIGTPREVDAASVAEAERRYPQLFLCSDPRTRRLLVAPHTDCPILFGLRATDPRTPLRALALVRSEPWDRWMLFRTNQGTGDHLAPREASELTGYRSGSVVGTVEEAGVALPGGHARLVLRDRAGGRLPCVAFEPTKTLPAVVRALVRGDKVRVWGSRGPRGTMRLEGVEVLRLEAPERWERPACSRCGRRTRSLGAVRGWRCPSCGGRLPPEAARRQHVPRSLGRGCFHPTPSARRHLAPVAP